jgi:hypothetical protein
MYTTKQGNKPKMRRTLGPGNRILQRREEQGISRILLKEAPEGVS